MTNESTEPGFDPRDSETVVRILDSLGTGKGRTVEEVAARSGIAVTDVTAVLGALEAEGRVTRDASGWVRQSANPT